MQEGFVATHLGRFLEGSNKYIPQASHVSTMFTWPDMYLSWGKALSGIPQVYVVRFENEMKEEGCNKDQGNGFHLPRWRICDWKQCRNQAQEHLTDQPLNLPSATLGLLRLCQIQDILRCRGSFACRCITGFIRFLALLQHGFVQNHNSPKIMWSSMAYPD